MFNISFRATLYHTAHIVAFYRRLAEDVFWYIDGLSYYMQRHVIDHMSFGIFIFIWSRL